MDYDWGGDSLLFEWGIYNWGKGEYFEVGLSRQIMLDLENYHEKMLSMTGLAVTCYFKVDYSNIRLGEGHKWCRSPSELIEFKKYVTEHNSFISILNQQPERISLVLGNDREGGLEESS
jgi:hypothetical protein